MEDRISALPDEIVSSILSRLKIKEAARTSVLSHRWEHWWKLSTGSLDFDGSMTMVRMVQEKKSKSLKTERNRYTHWVNQILNMHQGQNIEEFRVCFDLDKDSACEIDRWVNFAVEKRVQRLNLDLTAYNECLKYIKCYTFPLSPLGALSFNTLTSLCLKSVDLTDDVLAHFLSNCPFIEDISLLESPSLVNVKISGPLKLKYLELRHCFSLQSVEISATNLISFKYVGRDIDNPFKNVPLLSEISIGGFYSQHLVARRFYDIAGVLSQVETLELNLGFMVSERRYFIPKIFPDLCNLKQLELQVTAYPDDSILILTPLIDAAPCLYKLVVKLALCPPASQEYPRIPLLPCFDVLGEKPRERSNLECLKVVEIVGWVGHTTHLELAIYFLENTASLDKMIIDPRNPFVVGRRVYDESKVKVRKNTARECAKQLVSKLPPGTELVILRLQKKLSFND